MFTGIIETTANITKRTNIADVLTLEISKPVDWEVSIGQSIAVNGACLTVVIFDETTFTVELMTETLTKTTFADEGLVTVNLERAMPAKGRFEGHIVQGHVDTVGSIRSVDVTEQSWLIWVSYDPSFDYLVVEKGSITIDGISLTVIDTIPGGCSVGIIPHTLQMTALSTKEVDAAVQLEFDIIGKYLHKKFDYGRPQ